MKRLEARLSSISKKYTKKVPVERVAARIEFINSLVKIFTERLESDLDMKGDDLELERSIPGLVNYAYSYFYDIERHKDFHRTKKAGMGKVLPYTIKWILRFKPLSIKGKLTSRREVYVAELVNELFCIFLIEVYLDVVIRKKIVERLVYELRFRNVEAGSMNLIVELIRMLHTK